MSHYTLSHLSCKKDVDNAIVNTVNKVLVLRFGKDADKSCLKIDDIVSIVCVCMCVCVCASV